MNDNELLDCLDRQDDLIFKDRLHSMCQITTRMESDEFDRRFNWMCWAKKQERLYERYSYYLEKGYDMVEAKEKALSEINYFYSPITFKHNNYEFR